MFGSVLVANRGEIAYRIILTLKERGIESMLLVSPLDIDQLPARTADKVVLIDDNPFEAYLSIERIVEEAKALGAHAIHPGYGFLSENPAFARAVENSGIKFIGPTSEQMSMFGDKLMARKIAIDNEIPVSVGSDTSLSDEEMLEIAENIGFPLLIKAAAGGGGRGIRLVEKLEELDENLHLARNEAKLAFKDDRVYLEKFIPNGRHIEVQILGFNPDMVLNFGERDCSLQRKKQKLVEESPAPNLPKVKRSRLHKYALNLTSSIGYLNAGTVEFLYDGKEFHFLEVNTRIQVEHPVTEMVTGEDLVWRQLQIAAEMDPEISQKDITFKGHAIEARIYAEDPYSDFLPSPGKINNIVHPFGKGIRVDSSIVSGDEIHHYYDPLVSKLIAHTHSREASIDRLSSALDEYLISGIQTTSKFISDVIQSDDFRKVKHTTMYLDNSEFTVPAHIIRIGSLVSAYIYHKSTSSIPANQSSPQVSNWKRSGWRH